MTKRIWRTTNVNDTAVLSSAISLNSTTSTTILSANSMRIFVNISNESAQDVWIKLQAASVDNNKKWIMIFKWTNWQMPTDNIYTGEISAIWAFDSPDIYVTEY